MQAKNTSSHTGVKVKKLITLYLYYINVYEDFLKNYLTGQSEFKNEYVMFYTNILLTCYIRKR